MAMACYVKVSLLNEFADGSCALKFHDVDRIGLASILFLLFAESPHTQYKC